MTSVYIVVTIAAALVLIVFLIRNRLTKLDARGSTTEARISLEAGAQKPAPPPDAYPVGDGVDITGNTFIGSALLRIFGRKTRIARNLGVGKTRVDVGRRR